MARLPATLTLVHVTARSGNRKTGDIPVTYRPMTTCEPTCEFLPTNSGGCYGTGRIFGIARKYAQTATVDSIRTKLAHVAPNARFLRDRVVGDIVTASGGIDHPYMRAIATLARERGLIAFGYTHAWRRFKPADVERVARAGYVLNASCETRADIRAAINLGMPTVIASDLVEDGETFATPDGRALRVVTCPAQTREGTTCATCGLCARANRAAVVRFHIHGTARKRATATVNLREDH